MSLPQRITVSASQVPYQVTQMTPILVLPVLRLGAALARIGHSGLTSATLKKTMRWTQTHYQQIPPYTV